jgi:predicted secreted acid phosphatase
MTFDRDRWNAWVARRAARPLPGALGFVERVRELGGVVALVTNRAHEQCPATEDNLRAQGVPYDVILCRPPGSDGEKEPRFDSLREGTAAAGLPALEIVMFVGDNIGDFPGLDQSLRRAKEDAYADFGALGCSRSASTTGGSRSSRRRRRWRSSSGRAGRSRCPRRSCRR